MKGAVVGVLALSALADLSGVQAFVPGSVGLGAATSLQMSARHEHSSSSAAMTRRGAITLGSFAALGLGLAAPAEAKRKGDVKGLYEDDGTETKEERMERKRKVGCPHEKEHSVCLEATETLVHTLAICCRLVPLDDFIDATQEREEYRKQREAEVEAKAAELRAGKDVRNLLMRGEPILCKRTSLLSWQWQELSRWGTW